MASELKASGREKHQGISPHPAIWKRKTSVAIFSGVISPLAFSSWQLAAGPLTGGENGAIAI